MDDAQNGHEPSPAQQIELRRRLAEIERRLADLAQDGLRWPNGPARALRAQSAELELEADAIRHELGMPAALGRPPRDTWIGWVVVCVAAIAVVAVIFVVTR